MTSLMIGQIVLTQTRLLASSFCSQTKFSMDYSIHDICLNWDAFIFSL